jgi:prolyl oligopeptidase
MSYHRESNTLFVNVATFTAPAKVYSLDLGSFEWTLFFERENPIDTDEIKARIEFYKSKDGIRVPIFILHRKDLERKGDNPCIVYGYGGFNIGISPSFVGLNATFINRGGVYAIAGIRGGDEYGESWHRDGMLFDKQNTFDDFIAAAEYMISEGYTNSDRLACKGGSNGGLLVGAVMTQRPDLYKAVSCGVPLLDMVRFHKFLIARYWIPEYGDPDDPDAFRNILKYSPYHNVRTGIDHPTVLIRAGENDTRVDPLHAKKFAARLQNNPGQQNDVMLYIDYGSGHGSGKSTDQVIEDYELEMRWLMNELGMINP